MQSSTVLRMSIAGELPAIDHAVFADTGWEPVAVYEHLQVLKSECAAAGIQFHQVQSVANNLKHASLYDTLLDPNMFEPIPKFVRNLNGRIGMNRRQCTREYKAAPLNLKQRELVGLRPRQRSKAHLMTVVIGISWDESQRMRDADYPWMINDYPLVDLRMTRTDCLAWHEARGLPKPPRSSCVGCPYHSAPEWAEVAAVPADWARAVKVDKAMQQRRVPGYLHRSGRPLTEVDVEGDNTSAPSLFDTECEGLCGV